MTEAQQYAYYQRKQPYYGGGGYGAYPYPPMSDGFGAYPVPYPPLPPDHVHKSADSKSPTLRESASRPKLTAKPPEMRIRFASSEFSGDCEDLSKAFPFYSTTVPRSFPSPKASDYSDDPTLAIGCLSPAGSQQNPDFVGGCLEELGVVCASIGSSGGVLSSTPMQLSPDRRSTSDARDVDDETHDEFLLSVESMPFTPARLTARTAGLDTPCERGEDLITSFVLDDADEYHEKEGRLDDRERFHLRVMLRDMNKSERREILRILLRFVNPRLAQLQPPSDASEMSTMSLTSTPLETIDEEPDSTTTAALGDAEVDGVEEEAKTSITPLRPEDRSLAETESIPMTGPVIPGADDWLMVDGKFTTEGLVFHMKEFGLVAKRYYTEKMIECTDEKSIADEIKELKQRFEVIQNDKQGFNEQYAQLCVKTLAEKERTDTRPPPQSSKGAPKIRPYPSDKVVILNYLQALLEDIFSVAHLTQDKRLLQKIDKEEPHGFLSASYLATLKRIRHISTDKSNKMLIVEAASRSSFLIVKPRTDFPTLLLKGSGIDSTMESSVSPDSCEYMSDEGLFATPPPPMIDGSVLKELKAETIATALATPSEMDYYIGPNQFEKPIEKAWPLRQTIFVIGLPNDLDLANRLLTEMLRPFGEIKRCRFDDGPESADARYGARLLRTKARVHDLRSQSSSKGGYIHMHQPPMRWVTSMSDIDHKLDRSYGMTPLIDFGKSRAMCVLCSRTKEFAEGVYVSDDVQEIWCRKCAKEQADRQLETWRQYSPKDQIVPHLRSALLGDGPCVRFPRTALVVFNTQRQATNCTMLRSRIAWHGISVVKFVDYMKEVRFKEPVVKMPVIGVPLDPSAFSELKSAFPTPTARFHMPPAIAGEPSLVSREETSTKISDLTMERSEQATRPTRRPVSVGDILTSMTGAVPAVVRQAGDGRKKSSPAPLAGR
jgi:hypothetical protein